MRKFLYLITYLFTGNFWRAFLFNRTKVRVYLRGGSHVDFWCESWKITDKNGSCTAWNAKGLRDHLWFDPTEIVAWKEM